MAATQFDVRMTINFLFPVPGSLIYDVFQEIAMARKGFMVQRHTVDERTTYTLGITSDNLAEEAMLVVEGGNLNTNSGDTYTHLEVVHHLWNTGRAITNYGTHDQAVDAMKRLRDELRSKIIAVMDSAMNSIK